MFITTVAYLFFYINVQSPNLDPKLGIGSKNSKAGIFSSGKREGETERDWGNDQEIRFQEIEISVFQEIETLY